MTTTASPESETHDITPVRDRPRRRVALIGPLIVVLVGGLAVGRFLFAGSSSVEGSTTQSAGVGSELDALRARTVAEPESSTAWLAYGENAMRTAIATGDPAYYAAAQLALDTAVTLAPDSADAVAARAGLALSLHDFAAALPLAERAAKLNPFGVNALAALVDARLENGDYDGAETTLDQLLDVNPGTPAYARVSYFRQLTGDLEGARTAMQQAVGATGPGNGRAVVLGYLGDLNLELGNYDAAEKAYSTALTDQPGNIAAELGRARVLIARGSLTEAAARLDALVARSPQPAPATLQGELALLQGDSVSADAAFRLVRANQQILRSQGVIADIEYSNFDADRGDWASALETASAAHATRQTIFTADALAWALLNVGRTAEAVPLIEESLALGISTPSIRVHAAAIYTANRQPERARDELAVAFQSTPWLTPSIRPIAARLADELGLTLPQNWSSL